MQALQLLILVLPITLCTIHLEEVYNTIQYNTIIQYDYNTNTEFLEGCGASLKQFTERTERELVFPLAEEGGCVTSMLATGHGLTHHSGGSRAQNKVVPDKNK